MSDIAAKVLDYAFLSDPESPETFIVTREGAVRHWQEGTAAGLPAKRREQQLPELFRLKNVSGREWKWRKNYLPILEAGDNILFARGDELWCRTSDNCCRWPSGTVLDCDEFESAAAEIEKYWENWLNSGRILPSVSPRLDGAWRMSLIHSRCAFAGRHSKYGVEKYGEFRADGFPPAIISICAAFAGFDHVDEARELFAYYMKRFVRCNGTLDYYGSSFSEYGMLLETGAMLCGREGGKVFFREIHPFMSALCRYLYNVMNPWMNEPGSSYYLPCGSPEADRRKDKGEYFHNAAWIWRGFTELEKKTGMWMEKEERFELHHAAGVLRRRIDLAWKECREALKGFPPYAVHVKAPFDDCASSVETAYANYRYYPEMLSSGAFDRESMLAVIKVREECHGEIAGMTRLYWTEYPEELADHWTVFSYARGLMELGDRRRFMKLFRSHLVNYISPDLFYAYESVTVRGEPRFGYSDWCVPAQLALPLMLLASFSYTDWNGDITEWGGPDAEICRL